MDPDASAVDSDHSVDATEGSALPSPPYKKRADPTPMDADPSDTEDTPPERNTRQDAHRILTAREELVELQKNATVLPQQVSQANCDKARLQKEVDALKDNREQLIKLQKNQVTLQQAFDQATRDKVALQKAFDKK